MRRTVLFAVALLVAPLAAPAAIADGNVNFTLSARRMADSGWGDLRNQGALIAQVDFSPENWPVRFAFGLGGSARDEEDDGGEFFFDEPDRSARITEASFGLLWLPNRKSPTRPFIGAGIVSTWQRLELDESDRRDTDNSFGVYVNAGVYWRLGDRFNIGVDARVVRGTDGQLFGNDASADYGQIGLLLGFGW